MIAIDRPNIEHIAQIIMKMIEERRGSIKPEDNLNYLRAYIPIARVVIDALNSPPPHS